MNYEKTVRLRSNSMNPDKHASLNLRELRF